VFMFYHVGENLFEESNSRLLKLRHLSVKRKDAGDYGKNPEPLSEKDRENFKKELTRLLSNFQERN
jgi:uncharacterized protein